LLLSGEYVHGVEVERQRTGPWLLWCRRGVTMNGRRSWPNILKFHGLFDDRFHDAATFRHHDASMQKERDPYASVDTGASQCP